MARALALAGSILSLGLIAGSVAAQPAPPPIGDGPRVYIGSHGNAIYSARLDAKTGRLSEVTEVAQVERPTWLVTDPERPLLYSVSETGNNGKEQGGVLSLAIDPATGKLTPISKVASGGGGATHLTYDPRLHAVFVGNFGGGAVSTAQVGADGALSSVTSVQINFGSGPLPRQNRPHAHGVVVDPSGHYLLSPDMGADRIFVYRYDPATQALSPAAQPFEQTPAGSGPRHLVFSPDGRFAYLDTELSAEVRVFSWDATTGRLHPVQALSIDNPDFKGEKSAAEIAISKDGRFIYVSNRGENTLLVYAVNPRDGTLTKLQELACGGEVPWSFAIDPSGRWLLTANETSSNITVFAIDQATGKLADTGQSVAAPKPVVFAFYPK
ncbi:MAG TPA: lactonase family protein [Caulobacteraceae bacterium]|nr:lactonase family protein [Caulobacteraceae bacterium]